MRNGEPLLSVPMYRLHFVRGVIGEPMTIEGAASAILADRGCLGAMHGLPSHEIVAAPRAVLDRALMLARTEGHRASIGEIAVLGEE
jgi:hypothetical protein